MPTLALMDHIMERIGIEGLVFQIMYFVHLCQGNNGKDKLVSFLWCCFEIVISQRSLVVIYYGLCILFFSGAAQSDRPAGVITDG